MAEEGKLEPQNLEPLPGAEAGPSPDRQTLAVLTPEELEARIAALPAGLPPAEKDLGDLIVQITLQPELLRLRYIKMAAKHFGMSVKDLSAGVKAASRVLRENAGPRQTPQEPWDVPATDTADYWAADHPLRLPAEVLRVTDGKGVEGVDLAALAVWLGSKESPFRWAAPLDRGLWIYHPHEERYMRGEHAVRVLMARAAAPWKQAVSDTAVGVAVTTISGLAAMEPTTLDRRLPPRDTVVVPEGVLDLETQEIRPHSPDHLNTVRIAAPWSLDGYSPEEVNAAGDLLDQFLISTLPDPDDREAFLRACGLCLLREIPTEKFFVLLGGGANGKSTALRLLVNVLGAWNVAGETLQSLAENRFAAASLEGRLANVCPDIPTAKLQDTGTLKALVGRDLIRGERKYQAQFTFWNYATPIFSANTLPPANDHSEGFFRRVHVIVFSQNFAEDRADRTLDEKLARPAVLSVMLRMMVQALRDCRADNWAVPMSAAAKEELARYRLSQDSVFAWAEEYLESDPGNQENKDDIYAAYVAWAEASNVGKVGRNSFFRRLLALPKMAGVVEVQPRIEGQRVRCLAGVRLGTGPVSRTDLPL